MILNSPYISGSLTVTGNEVVTGSLTVLGGITGAITGSATSASYATNAELLDGLDSSVFVLSSSFQNYSSSNDGKVAALNTFSASILSYTSSTDDKIAQLNRETASLNLATASINNATASLYAATASIYNFTSSANLRIGSLEQYTQSLNTRSASFACVTATNNFACTQYFSNASNAVSFTSTGSLYSDGGMRITKDMYVSGTAFFNNVTVFGTQSVAYISSSQLNIGTNIISVNTDTPSIRFGGLAVYDSGSTGLTGSMLWDSEDNQWIYSNPSGSAYDSAVFLVGPRNVGVLGNEVGISCNFLSKGNGMHHMTSSGIFEDGSRTCFYGNASISSAGAACLAGTICSSGMDIMPSGIGSSTLGGIMRVVTAGTSTGIAVGQSNANRYTHIAANDIQVFNDDFFLSTRCAFPLSIGTCYTARLTFAATGIACFSCQVCAPSVLFNTVGTSTLVNTNITATTCFGASSRSGFTGLTDNCSGVYFGMGADGTGISAGMGFFRESSGWNSALAFYTNCITDGVTVPRIQEKMRITSGGNVLIGGTTNAFGLLDVTVAPSSYTAALGLGNITPASEGQSTGISFKHRIALDGNVREGARIAAITELVTSSGYQSLAFYTMNVVTLAERMRILYNGNVGIGDTSPQSGLYIAKYGSNWDGDVQYNKPTGNIFLSMGYSVANQDNWFGIRGNYGSSSGTANILLQANYRDVNSQAGHYIASKATALGVADFEIGKLTTSTSVSTPPTKVPQLYITSGGNVGIGTVCPSSRLTVNGNASIFGHLSTDRYYTTRGLVASTSGNWVNLYQLPTNYNYVLLIHVRQPETFYTYTTIAYVYNYYNGANNYAFVESYVKNGNTSLQISGGYIQARQSSGSNASMYWDLTIFGTLDTNF
jgi:hypothetical protein